MASGQSSNDSTPPPATDKVTDPRASARNESQQILDDVLQATLQLSKADAPMRPEEIKSLIAVARRRGDDPLSVETVAELVEAVLRMRFRRLVDSSSLWERMTNQIASTIFEDPRSKARMQQFWERLREAAQ
jgi:hypothetical protein